MKKSQRLMGVSVFALGLGMAASVNAAEVVWAGDFDAGGDIHVYDPSGNYVEGVTVPIAEFYGGMTTVGDEVWVGLPDSNTIARLDLAGNPLGSLPAFTTEGTGGMTTVGNEVWWGSAESATILRLDFAGNVLGAVDDDAIGLRVCPTGGMTTVGDEVWVGPVGSCPFGNSLLRYDLAGNWLGSASDVLAGLIAPPLSGGDTAAMTRIGDEVWWVGWDRITTITSDYYRMDSAGNVLGMAFFAASINVLPSSGIRFAMTTVAIPDPVPSIHPIALYTLVPGLLIGVGPRNEPICRNV